MSEAIATSSQRNSFSEYVSESPLWKIALCLVIIALLLSRGTPDNWWTLSIPIGWLGFDLPLDFRVWKTLGLPSWQGLPFFDQWYTEWVLPIKIWITDYFRWLDKEAHFTFFTMKEQTRAFSWVLKQPLIWSEFLLWKGAKPPAMLPIIWMMLAAVMAVVIAKKHSASLALKSAALLLLVVSIDGLPFIVASLAKAMKSSPNTSIVLMLWVFAIGFMIFQAMRHWGSQKGYFYLYGLIGILVLDNVIATVSGDSIPINFMDPETKPRALQDFGAFIGFSQWPADIITALGFKSIKAIPWIAVVLGFAIFGHYVGGWKLSIIVALCMSYLAVTGLWRESMKTFSLVVVAVPLSAALGLWLGVWVTRSKRAASIITPMFDVMQATPHLAYLVPVVVMFGAGQVPALMATVIFAMPPMARCTILAIQTVPSDVVESGHMSGCTPSQLLWKVQLPASQKTLLLGLNQVIMQTLAMVVIASLVGAQGLGHKLLFSLQQLKLGFATMQGIAIVLMAVVLDKLTQAYANRATDYEHRDVATFVQKHKHMLAFGGVLIGAILLAMFRIEFIHALFDFDTARNAAILGKKYLLVDSKAALELDKSIKSFTFFLIDYIKPVRDFITVYMLIPIRDFFQGLPWLLVSVVIGFGAFALGGIRLTLITVSMFFFIIVLPGNWEFATTTIYYVSIALVMCATIGVLIGVSATQDLQLLSPVENGFEKACLIFGAGLFAVLTIYWISSSGYGILSAFSLTVFMSALGCLLGLILSRVDMRDIIVAGIIGFMFSIYGFAGNGFTGWIIALVIGFIFGLILARLVRSSKVVLAICDTLQTFPSFIYLLPAIMLFKVGDMAIIFAIIPYAMVPAIRYTYLGLKRVPEVTLEAAKMAGTTPTQRLFKVQLPIAVPEIMLGVNQTIMMALAMLAITALIGGSDLGQEIYRALPTSDAGRGVMAGLGIATLGIIVDRLINAWADARKKELGIM